MSTLPLRQTERLHAGRVSAAGAIYFVTVVTRARTPWLSGPSAASAMLGALRAWHSEGDGSVLAATVMPDHIHALFSLGKKYGVGRCVSRWKTTPRQTAGYPGEWQRDFWEHRVRGNETWEDYGLYMFLNPYRAGLIGRSEVWPWWWAPDPDRFQFTAALDSHGHPPHEWMALAEDRFADLSTGA